MTTPTDELSRVRFAARFLAITCLGLMVVIAAMLFVVLRMSFWTVPMLRNELFTMSTLAGASTAASQYRAGRTKSMRAVEADANESDDKMFDHWTFTNGWPGSKESADAFVKAFNGRMDILVERGESSINGEDDSP